MPRTKKELKTKSKKNSKINKYMEQPPGLVNERGFPIPLVASCFRCHENFSIKYNPAIGMYTQKNYFLYWVSED